ncbi:TIGR03618 family F420-dependent PPOX class oxidoreductase [Streptomyces sp. DSM 42041]|uniref:TIGR03618 family F420-dependent PPOX class oxidoreductase n=1 Tax=Streptomyces hazeniae TaxID=3075538 RepID=A0ABU2NVP9_9ACTN|nr:TIGR03618 family F420-dependent PPOX class oxidoreductase [Streptomyces sp. DSM 42041]MDT0379683.1 TIGR03618 family F420-dependent PPOX class oxidoreductase [Streptomyces sp. DSM 42041]
MALQDDPAFLAFWRERHYSTLTTFRPDGTPHVVPVSVTYDPGTRTARVVARGTSRKVRNVRAAGPEGSRVALCQVDRRRWATLEGRAVVRTEPSLIADAEERYEARYGRRPKPNPERVLIEVTVDRTMSRL